MKKLLGFIAAISILTVLVVVPTAARDTNTHMNAAYWKGDDKFDIVVKQTPGLTMKLYVNDKDPTETTVNSEGWATFKKVKLNGSGKISFTWVDSSKREHPIDYTSKFNVTDPKATFSSDEPEPATQPAASNPSPAPQPQAAPQPPAPKPQPQPAAAPQASVYYKNCAAARAAGAAPVYRGSPGYGAHLDRDNDGIGCE